MRIGIDLMGSDRSPVVLFDAMIQAVERFPDVHFTVFITNKVVGSIYPLLDRFSAISLAHIKLEVVFDAIEMHDEPLLAIRKKKNSSLVLGLQLLKRRELDGLVSAGNTGALIAGATLLLSLLSGIQRPALLASLPTEKNHVAIIDVGGHVSCKADYLVQFAQLGVAYQQCYAAIEKPRVGLLNIGVESKKGTSEVRHAYELLQELARVGHICFIGNVEGREVFQGDVDVVVTDGFTGNVLLKTSEGISSFMLQRFEQMLQQQSVEQPMAFLGDLHHQFDVESYRGALVCGVDGVVIKCHGQSSAHGLFQGICGAVELVQNGFVDRIRRQLESGGIR